MGRSSNQQVDVNAIDQSLLADIRERSGCGEVRASGRYRPPLRESSGKTTTIDASTSVLDTTRVLLVTVAVVLIVLAVIVLIWPGPSPSASSTASRCSRSHVGNGTSESSTVVAPASWSSAAGCGPVVTATMCAPAARRGAHVVGRVADVDRGPSSRSVSALPSA